MGSVRSIYIYLCCVCDLLIHRNRPGLHFQGVTQRVEETYRTRVRTLLVPPEEKKSLVTFELRLSPIKVWCVGKVLPVEIEALTKLHQLAKFFDQSLPSQSRLSVLLQGVRK